MFKFCFVSLAKGLPIRNIGILTQRGDFLPITSPLIEKKKCIQDDFTLSKVSESYGFGNSRGDGMLFLADYGSKMYFFDTGNSDKDVLRYNLDTHSKDILPETGMPYARYGSIKSTKIGRHLWVGTLTRKNMNLSYSIQYVCTERNFDSPTFMYNQVFLKKLS